MRTTIAAILTAFLTSGSAGAQETGLEGPGVFRWNADGLRLETAALVHDQVRGFFIGRGFDERGIDVLLSEACLFRSAIGNSATAANAPDVHIDQSEWRVHVNGETRPIRRRLDWTAVWDRLGVGTEQRVAFKWALFPPRQTFKPNDYNWGMITMGLPPGTRFDLDVVWHVGDQKHVHRFAGMECAKP